MFDASTVSTAPNDLPSESWGDTTVLNRKFGRTEDRFARVPALCIRTREHETAVSDDQVSRLGESVTWHATEGDQGNLLNIQLNDLVAFPVKVSGYSAANRWMNLLELLCPERVNENTAPVGSDPVFGAKASNTTWVELASWIAARGVSDHAWPRLRDTLVIWTRDFPADEPISGRSQAVDAAAAEIPGHVRRELSDFSDGVGSARPAQSVVEMAFRIAQVAVQCASYPDITTDVDGELSFYLKLLDGRLVMAELAVVGSIDVAVYDNKDKLLERKPHATEKEFIAVLYS